MSGRFFYIAIEKNERCPVLNADFVISKFYTDFSECVTHIQTVANFIADTVGGTIEGESLDAAMPLCLTVTDKAGWVAKCAMFCEDNRGSTIH